jgi:hypothetical protein
MASIEEQILKATKEIVVKFIEAGRISPSGFHETFKNVHKTVSETVKGSEKTLTGADSQEEPD